MHSFKTIVLSSFLSLAFAAKLADHVPVTIENLDSTFDVKCGSTTVKGTDIYNAIAYGMSLNENDEQNTSSDSETTHDQRRFFPAYV